MILEYIRYQIPEAQCADFEESYGRAQEALQNSPHCLAYDLARCTEAPEHYILRIEWDSLDGHLMGFRRSEAFRAFLKEVRPFIQNLEEMRHYEGTGLTWRRS